VEDKYIEVFPLPQICQDCQEVKEFGVDAACYNCDYCLERFKPVFDTEKLF